MLPGTSSCTTMTKSWLCKSCDFLRKAASCFMFWKPGKHSDSWVTWSTLLSLSRQMPLGAGSCTIKNVKRHWKSNVYRKRKKRPFCLSRLIWSVETLRMEGPCPTEAATAVKYSGSARPSVSTKCLCFTAGSHAAQLALMLSGVTGNSSTTLCFHVQNVHRSITHCTKCKVKPSRAQSFTISDMHLQEEIIQFSAKAQWFWWQWGLDQADMTVPSMHQWQMRVAGGSSLLNYFHDITSRHINFFWNWKWQRFCIFFMFISRTIFNPQIGKRWMHVILCRCFFHVEIRKEEAVRCFERPPR